MALDPHQSDASDTDANAPTWTGGAASADGTAGRQRVAVAQRKGVVHVTFPAGKADGVAVRELYEASVPFFGAHHMHMVVDLTGTKFVPSGMMGMLLTLKKRLSGTGGQLHVVIPDPLVRASFETMGLHRVLTIHQVIDDAAKHF